MNQLQIVYEMLRILGMKTDKETLITLQTGNVNTS